MVTGTTTVSSSDLPHFFYPTKDTGIKCSDFEIVVNAIDFPTHRQATADESFYLILKPHLNTALLSHKVRCNGVGKATWLYSIYDIPEHARKHSWNKLFMTYAVFKDKEDCTGSGSDDEDVLQVFMLSIDLDGIATMENVATLRAVFSECVIVMSTGIQILMRFSGDYETGIRMLSALATLAEKLCPNLRYDRRCHFRDDGSVANHRNHPMRLPYGSKKSDGEEKVLCFIPKSGEIADVSHVFNTHDVEMPPLVITQENDEHIKDSPKKLLPKQKTMGSRKKRKNIFRGSEGYKYEEYDKIRQALTDCVLKGMNRAQAENEVASMPWLYHTERYLRRTLHKASLKCIEKSKLPREAVERIRRDTQLLTYRLGPSSLKRLKIQKSFYLGAQRAWAYEFLFYVPSMTREEAIEAFFKWPEFKKVRALSIAAIGEEAVREDLARLWDKFNHRDLIDNPYVNLQPVSRATKALVYRKARLLRKFKMAGIQEQLALSEPQTRTALSKLCEEGKLKKDGNNSGRVYSVVEEEEEGGCLCSPFDCRVPAISGMNRGVKSRSDCYGLDTAPTRHDIPHHKRFTEPIKRKIRSPVFLPL